MINCPLRDGADQGTDTNTVAPAGETRLGNTWGDVEAGILLPVARDGMGMGWRWDGDGDGEDRRRVMLDILKTDRENEGKMA